METFVIEPRSKSNVRRLTKPPSRKTDDLSDEQFIASIPDTVLISRIEKILHSENIDRIEVLEALYNCKNREDLEELYEDMVLLRMMEDDMKDPDNVSVSMDEIKKILRQR